MGTPGEGSEVFPTRRMLGTPDLWHLSRRVMAGFIITDTLSQPRGQENRAWEASYAGTSIGCQTLVKM
jgi:hypothetical protein